MIEILDVTKRYGNHTAVQSVSLSVAKGDLLAVVGGSGSGKTTLVKMVNRLVEPDEGTVRVEGEDVRGQAAAQLRRRIGYVFQGVGLFPHMTVGENIGAVPRLLGWSGARIAARTGELLEMVGLPPAYAARAPAALSGGERQRVGVARALAARPSIVLMDEPFGALDPVTRDGLGQAYRGLHEALGLTTVMVTHDVQEAVLMADRVAVMAEGRLLAEGTPQEMLADHPEPQVRALMQTPRRQAERVQAMVAAAGAAAP